MANYYIRSTSAVTAQASAAITADALSTGTKTEIDTTSSGNANGVHALEFEIDVTVAPTTAGYAEIWCEPLQHDGTGNSAEFRISKVPIQIATSADKYLCFYDGVIPEKANYIIKAMDFGFTASLSVRGKYASDT